MSAEKFYTEDEEETRKDVSLDSLENELDFDNSIVNTPDILVIRESRTQKISGVRSCDDSNRHRAEAQNCFKDFIKDTLYEHRHLKYLDSNIENISAKWKNRTDWRNRRSCKGSITVICVARFQKYN